MSRYAAFISYSHADTPTVRWLHHALETFRVPKALVGTPTPLGPAPRRLAPIFRDRDELPASGDLGTELRAALADAAFLIVICSPRSAQSHWVNEEILAFKRLHGDGRVLALIASGEPYSADNECFPPALRFRMGPGGVLTTEAAEPIAADIRPGKDGKRLAHLKLMAGLTGLKLDQLVQREAARRQRRLAYIASGAVAVAAVTLLLAFYALRQRDEARRQREMAEASLDFLVNTFSIANPATENPRTITAVTILNRVSARVEHEMKRTPQVSAKLLTTTGSIWLNLGLFKESERDLQAALRLAPGRGKARANILLKLARVALERTDTARATKLIDAADAAFDHSIPAGRLIEGNIALARGTAAYVNLHFARAAQFNHAAAQAYADAEGDNGELLSRALSNEGTALVALKRFDQASEVLARARAVANASFGPGDVRTATIILNLANVSLNANRLADARARCEEALAVFRKVLEPGNPKLLDTQLLYGRIQHSQHDFVGAINTFRHVSEIAEHAQGSVNSYAADADFYLAMAFSDDGRSADALDALARTKYAYDKLYGPLDPDQVELLDKRAQVLRAAGRSTESSADCEAALRLRARLNASDPELPTAKRRCVALAADPPGISLRFQ